MRERNRKELEERRLRRGEAELVERLEYSNSIIEPKIEPSLRDRVLGMVFGPLGYDAEYWCRKRAPKQREE